jgi:RNA polymerase sigma-70 factor (ECF subfamily)
MLQPAMPATHTEQVQQLFVRHTGLLHGFIASLCGDLVLAEDILQEVFLVISQRAGDFTIGSDFPAWARAIARFKTMELLRARRRDRQMFGVETLAALEADAPGLEAWQQEREVLAGCIAKLTTAQHALMAMAYGDGRTPAQIAAARSQSPEVVHVLLSRVRRILRDCVLRRLGMLA